AIKPEHEGELAATQFHCALRDRIEHRLDIRRRAGNDAQYLRRGGLLLQRFSEVGSALAQFVEQPRVLDSDDGLGGEVRQHLDLFVSERSNLLPVDIDSADQRAILEHWHTDK